MTHYAQKKYPSGPKPTSRSAPKKETSWQGVSQWYNKSVGREGHYYHQAVVLPSLLRLLEENGQFPTRLLDVGCGQGVLARRLPPAMDYLGIDLSSQLLQEAKKQDSNRRHRFMLHDMTEPLTTALTQDKLFDAAAMVLSLQNVEQQQQVIGHLAPHIAMDGRLIIVLNHPCFRVPRQSSWQIDEQKQCRFRRLERYLSPLSVPISMQPSLGEESPVTWSFHYPISSYMQWLQENGFVLVAMEEWCSDKKSTGKFAKMENRSREEFPLFLTLVARKVADKKASAKIEKSVEKAVAKPDSRPISSGRNRQFPAPRTRR